MFFTDEQFETLKEYKRTFETATRSGFARNVGSVALKRIEDAYNEANGAVYEYNKGCSLCVLQFIKKVAGKFFEDEKERNEIEQTQPSNMVILPEKAEDTVKKAEEAPVKPKTNKRTRKKKEDGTE